MTNGLSANTAPAAAVAAVATVRNFLRPGSISLCSPLTTASVICHYSAAYGLHSRVRTRGRASGEAHDCLGKCRIIHIQPRRSGRRRRGAGAVEGLRPRSFQGVGMSLHKLGQGLVFLIGATVGGLALAFVVVYFNPELLVRTRVLPAARPSATETAAPANTLLNNPAGTDSASDGAKNAALGIALHSFAAAVHRAAPAVVNIYTARVVTERVQPNSFEQLFGGYGPRFQQRVQRALGSGVIVDAAG